MIDKLKHTYTLQAGRCILRDGIPFVTIHGCCDRTTGEGFDPTAWDNFARGTVRILNALEGVMETFEDTPARPAAQVMSAAMQELEGN